MVPQSCVPHADPGLAGEGLGHPDVVPERRQPPGQPERRLRRLARAGINERLCRYRELSRRVLQLKGEAERQLGPVLVCPPPDGRDLAERAVHRGQIMAEEIKIPADRPRGSWLSIMAGPPRVGYVLSADGCPPARNPRRGRLTTLWNDTLIPKLLRLAGRSRPAPGMQRLSLWGAAR